MEDKLQRLWTPWRMAYVTDTHSDECFLCEKPAQGEAHDAENLILYRGANAFVILNLYPYNPGHLMVAPYAHTNDLVGLDAKASTELWELSRKAVDVLSLEYQASGFNIGLNLGVAGGAGQANHLHIHVVPRWVGDTNFMAVTGDTKVLPEDLARTYGRLRLYFRD
jgi:ATP adenylyltransferase